MLRPVTDMDLPAILDIEQTVQITPWSEAVFKKSIMMGATGWVLEKDQKVAGFIFLLPQAEHLHILNFAIAKAYQRQGLGTQLLLHSLSEAEKIQAHSVFLEVRLSNQAAIALYQRHGFSQIGIRAGYYSSPQGPENALVFAKVCRPD